MNNSRTVDVAAPVMATIPIPLQEALRDSITSGSFVDTKFWLFSKRRSNSGRVGGPKALFVNERVARRVSRLGAREAASRCPPRSWTNPLTVLDKENLRTRFSVNKKLYTSDYGYEDDSDLEEDGGEDDDETVAESSEDESVVAPQVAAEKSGNCTSELVAIGKSDTKSNEPSDIISVSDLDSFSESPDTKDESNTARVGKVVVIKDVAFVTYVTCPLQAHALRMLCCRFQALLRYLYTDEIEFAPWGSAERRKARALETVSEPYGIPKPSPKSIYRLAGKVKICPAIHENGDLRCL